MIKHSFAGIAEIVISQTGDGNIDQRFQDASEVAKNLKHLAVSLKKSPKQFVQMEQTHACDLINVSKKHAGKIIPKVDGLITRDKEIVLMLRIADCIPVFIADSKNRAIALVHSGWKGTIGKITLVAIQFLMRRFNSDPAELYLYLGPSLKKCSNLSQNPIQLELPEWEDCISRVNGYYAVDMQKFVTKTALAAGINENNIEISPQNTFTKKQYFSFRRSSLNKSQEGRFAAMIYLK